MDLQPILNKRIFFGHQSVGSNIIDGIQNILADIGEKERIPIVDLKGNGSVDQAGFYHDRIGKNRNPYSKIESFKNYLIEQELGEFYDIAFIKFCFVDINKDTNVDKLFLNYQLSMNEISDQFPNVKILHVTTPLKSRPQKFRKNISRNLKKLLGMTSNGDLDNVNINRYNRLMRNAYSENGLIFDLAKIESENSDGSRSTFRYQGNEYMYLSSDLTNDGGHLNQEGKLKSGKKLLQTLAKISG